MRVYLCGNVSAKRFSEANSWREHAEQRLAEHSIETRNPLRGSKTLHGRRRINPDEYVVPELSDAALVQRDRLDVKESDCILAHLDPDLVSIGSMFELGMSLLLSQLVVVVLPKNSKNAHWHPFVRQAGVTFEDLDQALDFIIDSCSNNV